MTKVLSSIDLSFIDANKLAAGVDEAGRGPLAGSVVAASVILPLNTSLEELGLSQLTDSKKLSEKKREQLFPIIKEKALAWAVAWSNCSEIDSINILQASLLAMRRSLLDLDIQPEQVLVDGNKLPQLPEAWVSTTANQPDPRLAQDSTARLEGRGDGDEGDEPAR